MSPPRTSQPDSCCYRGLPSAGQSPCCPLPPPLPPFRPTGASASTGQTTEQIRGPGGRKIALIGSSRDCRVDQSVTDGRSLWLCRDAALSLYWPLPPDLVRAEFPSFLPTHSCVSLIRFMSEGPSTADGAVVAVCHHRNINLVAGFTTFSATLVGLSFVFGNSIRTMCARLL